MYYALNKVTKTLVPDSSRMAFLPQLKYPNLLYNQ